MKTTLKVMTFNIRYWLAEDGINNWEFRKPLVIERIRAVRARKWTERIAWGIIYAVIRSNIRMNYGNILTATWKTIWKEKAIIAFGMLMMVAPALLGLFIGGGMTVSSPEKLNTFFDSGFWSLGVLIFIVLYLLFIAGTVVLSAVSFSGTMKGVLMAQESSQPLTFSMLWGVSQPYIWRMLGVMLSVGFVLMLVYVVPIVLMALVGALTAGIGFLCIFPLFLLLIPLGVVGYLTLSLSMAALIAEDGGVFDSIRRGWDVMKAKFWQLVLMTVILYFIQMGIAMIIALPLNILQFAFILPMQTGEIDPNALFRYMGVMLAIFMPISAIVQGFALTYVNGAWMLSYREVTQAPNPPTQSEDEIVEYDA